MRTNYIKAKINNTQQIRKCRLFADREGPVNQLIKKWSKQAQKKYKTRHDRVGKVNDWELHKSLELDHATKCYMNKLESL